MNLYISTNKPSKELDDSEVDKAITILAHRAAIALRNGMLPSGPKLDITFMLPFKDDVPNFTGMRMGGYTNDNETLFFEAAVPDTVVRSEKANYYVELVLQDMIDNANEFFTEMNIPFAAEHWLHAMIPDKSFLQ